MDKRILLFSLLALVAICSGFRSTRKIRPGYIKRTGPGTRPKFSLNTRITKHQQQGGAHPPTKPSPSINHKVTIKNVPRTAGGGINIISNIFLKHPTNAPPNAPQGSRPGGNARRGQRRNPHSQGQQQRGYVTNGGQGFHGQPSMRGSQQPRMHGSQFANLRQGGPKMAGGQFQGNGFGGIVPAASGQFSQSGSTGALGQPGSSFNPNTGVSQSKNPSGAAKSQIVILPNGPNTNMYVLSAEPGIQFTAIKSKNGKGEILLVPSASNSANQAPMKQSEFITMTTLKPGEDPPEIENQV